MLDILEARPSVGSWKCDPMTITEIDAHPDADRIWATIRAVQGAVDDAREEGYESAGADIKATEDDAYNNARAECAKDLRDLLDDIADDLTKKAEEDLEALADEWS